MTGEAIPVVDVVEAMEALAANLRGSVSRPVVTDPRDATNLPCVLIEPPTVDASTSTACGVLLRFAVLVIGLPGARTELTPLSDLLGEVLDACSGVFTLAEPVGYVPLAGVGAAEPVQAYRVTMEEVS